EEEQPDDPDRQEEWVHQAGAGRSDLEPAASPAPALPVSFAAATCGAAAGPACGRAARGTGSTASMISVVVPIRTWSPSPSAIDSPRRSFTQEPFVLTRSASTSE